MIIYNKLVRDKIPGIIKQDNQEPIIKILEDHEYKQELLKKLVEEANEVLTTKGEVKELVKELGDVQEVVNYIIKAFNLDKEEIEKTREKRKLERGGFDKKIMLEKVK